MSRVLQQLCWEWRRPCRCIRCRSVCLALPSASCLTTGSCCRIAEGAPATTCPRSIRVMVAVSSGSEQRRRIMAVRTPPFVPRAANASCLCQLPTPPFKQHKLSTRPPPRLSTCLPAWLAWPPAFGVGPDLSHNLTLPRRAAARHVPVPVQVSRVHEDARRPVITLARNCHCDPTGLSPAWSAA